MSHLFLDNGLRDVKVKSLGAPTGLAGSISYIAWGAFKPLTWFITLAPGILFSLFIRDGNFQISGTEVR